MNLLPQGLETDFTRDCLAEDYAKALFDYWHEARGSAALPPVSAIDPVDLPNSCLPYLSILEVERDPLRLRARLTGSALVEQFGMNQAGHYLDELPGTQTQLARIEWCVREKRPYLASAQITFAPNDYRHYQILVLPFGDSATGVQRIVGVFCFLEGFDSFDSWVT